MDIILSMDIQCNEIALYYIRGTESFHDDYESQRMEITLVEYSKFGR